MSRLSTTLALSPGKELLGHVLPHELFSIAGFEVTNHLVMTLVAAALVVLVFGWVAKRMRITNDGPEGYLTKGVVAHLFEVLCMFIREYVTRPALGHLTDRYIGYVWSMFFFVLFMNLIGMFPIGPILRIVTVSPHAAHWAGTPTANISITGGMALVSGFMILFVGIREHGLSYFKHYAPVPFKPIGMIPVAAMLVVLEIIGLFIKVFALCIRLFANMIAGHMVIAALLGMIFIAGTASVVFGYIVAIPAVISALLISLLEVFVAFLHAYIFAFLTVLFIAAGAVDHGEHGEEVSHEEASEEMHGFIQPANEAQVGAE